MTGQEQKKYKRKIIFIKRAAQFKMLGFVLVAVMFGMSFVFYEYSNLLEKIFSSHPVLLQEFFNEAHDLLLWFVAKLLICFGVIAIITAVLTNKIVGPMYKMEQTCRAIARGDFAARARLRSGDGARDLSKEFNQMMDKLEPKLRSASGEVKTEDKKGEN